jgi:modulator of FtsH protease
MRGDWSAFYSAMVGAGAALTGLVFVALSINLRQILAGPGLPRRAGEAIILLMQPVIVGAIVLIPAQDSLAIGIELIVVGTVSAYQVTAMILRSRAIIAAQPLFQSLTRVGFAELATLPTVVAGGLLAAGVSQGFYVLAATMLVCFFDGVLDAWVLLVEILR